MVQIFSEIGIGNDSFCSTEIEKGFREHRIKGFVIPPHIKGIYLRIWIGKRVLVISSNGLPTVKRKKRLAFKFLVGLEGLRRTK